MSTRIEVKLPNTVLDKKPDVTQSSCRNDRLQVRILRFALGLTLAVAIVFGFEWPLSFVTLVFTALFLSLPTPSPTVYILLRLIAYVIIAFSLGLLFTVFFIPYPFIYLIMLGLVLFHLYYFLHRGGPALFVILCLVSVLLPPIIGMQSDAYAIGFSLYFAISAMLAVIIYGISHAVLPEPENKIQPVSSTGFQPGYSKEAAITALKATVAVFPVAVFFIVFNLKGEILLLVYSAIFVMSAELAKGSAAAFKSLKATLLGGLAAIVFFTLLVLVPQYHFLILLMFLACMLFAIGIFTEHAYAKYMGSAAIAFFILISTSISAETSAFHKLFIRVLLLFGATAYVILSLAILERFWPTEKQN